MCDKFSGADLKELCNQICKCAIKESIEAEIQKKHLMKDGREADIDVMEDPVPTLTRRHFEYGLAHCRISVGEADLSRYEEFKRKFDPTFNNNKNNSFKMNWPDSDGKIVQQVQADEDLDLYS
jgi:transitional endoplasmic reticulum ATPase